MASINSREIVDRIIERNGGFDEDNEADEPMVVKIVEYTNAWGRQTYGLVYEGEDAARYDRPTEFVRNPVTIWEMRR